MKNSEWVAKVLGEEGILQGIGVIFAFEPDIFIPLLSCFGGKRLLEPLGLYHLGLRNDLLLKDHRRLHNEQLLAFILRSITVRRSPPRVDIFDSFLEYLQLPALVLLLLVTVRRGLDVETRLSFGNDEAGPERDLARSRLVPFVSTALVEGSRGWCQVGRNVGAALLDKAVDLLVDILVALHELTHQFSSVLLLLQFIVDVVLEELFFVELEQGVELKELASCLLLGDRLLHRRLFLLFLLRIFDIEQPFPSFGGAFVALFQGNSLFLMLLSAAQMLSHINFAFCLGFSPFLILIFFRTNLDIAGLFVIELFKPYIFPLLNFVNIFINFVDLFLIFVDAVIDDVLHVVFDDKGLSFEYLVEHYLKTIELFY